MGAVLDIANVVITQGYLIGISRSLNYLLEKYCEDEHEQKNRIMVKPNQACIPHQSPYHSAFHNKALQKQVHQAGKISRNNDENSSGPEQKQTKSLRDEKIKPSLAESIEIIKDRKEQEEKINKHSNSQNLESISKLSKKNIEPISINQSVENCSQQQEAEGETFPPILSPLSRLSHIKQQITQQQLKIKNIEQETEQLENQYEKVINSEKDQAENIKKTKNIERIETRLSQLKINLIEAIRRVQQLRDQFDEVDDSELISSGESQDVSTIEDYENYQMI